MALDLLKPGWTGTSPLALPFKDALDRMRRRERVLPEQMQDRATALLLEAFGAQSDDVRANFAQGSVGIVSEHTHYFDGFALMLPLDFGVALAVRAGGPGFRVVLEGHRKVHLVPEGGPSADTPEMVRVLYTLWNTFRPGEGADLALVSNMPLALRDATLAAIGVALCRLAASETISRQERLMQARASITEAAYPFSPAYLVASHDGQPGVPTLIDTLDYDFLPLPFNTKETLGWGLLIFDRPPLSAGRYRVLQRLADRALAHVQQSGFPHITSFRLLEHRELSAVLDVVPEAQRPTIQYLVTENRRVQNAVVALRRGDLQVLGSVLTGGFQGRLEWDKSEPEEHEVLDALTHLTMDGGVYGAALTGHSRTVLLAARPIGVPLALDRLRQRLAGLPDAAPAESVLL